MNELTSHTPSNGFPLINPAENSRYGERVQFDKYRPFIRTPNLDPKDQQLFITLLCRLHALTADLWRPGLCNQTVFLQQAAKTLVNEFWARTIPKIYQFSKYPGHSWTVLESLQMPLLIIDAAGLNDGVRTSNLPFFGTLVGVESRATAHLYYSGGAEISQEMYQKYLVTMRDTTRPRKEP